MFNGLKDQLAIKKEIKRLEKVKPGFLAGYMELCKKFNCQLVPVTHQVAPGLLQMTTQLDSYFEPDVDKSKTEAEKSEKIE